MTNMTLEVSFLAGTDIKYAVKDAKQKAINLNLAYIKFNFNGIYFSIGQGSNLDDVLKKYRNKDNYICA